MKQRTLIFGVSIGLLSLVTAACTGGGGGDKIAANPAAAHYPTTYQPKPGDLLFYTNGSISYNSKAKHPWVVVIDAKAKTKKIVAASEISGVESSPHGLGASPDGTRLYMPAGIGKSLPALAPSGGSKNIKFGTGVTVIDSVTLKAIQSIPTVDAPHHMQLLNDSTVMSDAWGKNQVLFTLDPSQDNKMTHALSAVPFGGRPYIAFPTPDGRSIYMTVRPATKPGETDGPKKAWIARVDLSNWSVKKVAEVGPGAVWTQFTRDGKFAYVSIGEEDWVEKVDLSTGAVVAKVSSGRGPYGLALSPDEKRLFVVSKGEGGHGQRGGTFVVIDAESMQLLEERPACKAFVCQPDHALISPDGSELWIDNNMGYITIFDAKTYAMKTEITMPLLADPHGGVFVQYDNKGKGHVVMDIGGPHGGVSPYLYDNQNGIPTLAQALAKGWGAAKASSPLALATGTTGTTGIEAPSTGKPVTVTLTMEDFYFKPKDVTIPAGSLVTFKLPNPGQVAHNFASADLKIPPHDVNTGDIGTVTWKADVAPGTYKFVCTYHPGMEGTITVK